MSSNRLEFHSSVFSKVRIGFLCVFTAVCGFSGLWLTITTVSPNDRLLVALASGLSWIFFILVLRESTKVFAKEPQITIDEEAIVDHQGQKPLVISWDDVKEISFPLRYVQFYSRDFVLSVEFVTPQKYPAKAFRGYEANRMVRSSQGDYEISFNHLKGKAADAYHYLRKLQKHGKIPATVQINGGDLNPAS